MPQMIRLTPFKNLLLRTCGHSFEHEREQTLRVVLERRMKNLQIGEYDDYHARLLNDQDELLRLTEMLTVNETYFFREPGHLDLIVDKLLPEFMNTRLKKPISILSAGCSTGEEPYSIAIMLRERFGAECEKLFTITGVDIDTTVIAAARQGNYGMASFRGINQSLHERYFEQIEQGKFRVSEPVRRQVGFEVVNLLGKSYPDKMMAPDIILYRNVSIYFPGDVQKEIFGKLADLLAGGGCLFVGAAETLHHNLGILSLVKQDSLFFYRKTPPLIIADRRASERRSQPTPVSGSARQTVTPSPGGSSARRSLPLATQMPAEAGGEQAVLFSSGERFAEAIKLARNKQYEEALATLDFIIDQDSAFGKAYCLKGSLLLSISRFAEARIVCEAILRRDQLCLEAYLMLGMIARQEGDNDGALRRFREAIYLDPFCWLAHFHTAEICYAQQDEKRARNGYETALRTLTNSASEEPGQRYFPLSFNPEQFVVICRHKLSLLTPKKG